MTALATPTPHGPSALKRVFGQPLLWLLIAIVVIGVVTSQYFFTPSNMENLLRDFAVFGFLALGVMLVMLTGRIDLSVGALMIFSMIASIDLMQFIGPYLDIKMMSRGSTYVGPTVPLVLVALAIGALAGLVNGLGVAYGKVTSFVMTLVTLSALRGLSYTLTNGRPYYLRGEGFKWLGEAAWGHVPVGLIALGIAFALFAWLLHAHVVGKRIYAIGGDEKTARHSGINVSCWVVLAFVASGVCAACAGILFTSRLMSADAPMANGYELTAIAIAVLGGTQLNGGHGSPYKTLCAGLIFAIGLNLLTLHGVNAWYQNLIVGVALIGVVGLAQGIGRHKQAL